MRPHTTPPAHSASPSALRFFRVQVNLSMRPLPPASLAAITTVATVADHPVWPHCFRPLPNRASDPAPIELSSKARQRAARTSPSMGPDALPAAMESLKPEAQRRLVEWATTGHSLASSSLYDAGVWFCTGLGDLHSHDGQIACFLSGYTPDLWSACLNVDLAQYFDDASAQLAPDKESIIILANQVLPHSEGEIVLESADPSAHPSIRMNYFTDPHDLKVMVAVIRRALAIVANWPSHRKLGALHVPPALAAKHGHTEGAPLTDELLEDLALHFSITVYQDRKSTRL